MSFSIESFDGLFCWSPIEGDLLLFLLFYTTIKE